MFSHIAVVALVGALIVHSNCVNVPPPFGEPGRALGEYCSVVDRRHPWLLTIVPTALLAAAVIARRSSRWVRFACA